MSSALYIGLTVPGGGVYRRDGGRLKRIARVSRSGLPARYLRLVLARAILSEVLVGAPGGEAVQAFAEEILADVELGGLFSVPGACVHNWIALRNDSEVV